MSDIIDINVAQTIEEVTINATPNLIEVNINNINAGKHSDLVLDDGTNPHGTTKTDVGLSNVPNLDTTNAVNLAHTHSNFSALNALSGTNTGDETTLSIQTKRPLKTINSTSLEGSGNIEINVDFSTHDLEELKNVTLTNYTTPIDTDSLLTYDVTNLLWKRLSWSNIKSNLKTYFDGIYTTTSAVATQITTALSGYATQAWVTSQGYITNVITALGFTPENISNKSTLTTLGTSDTLYPTQNAVKNYVDSKIKYNYKNTTIYNHTGTNAATLLFQTTIPANTLLIGDLLEFIVYGYRVSGTANNIKPLIRISNTNNFSTATPMAITSLATNQTFNKLRRESLVISNNLRFLYPATNETNVDYTTFGTVTDFSINFSQDIFIFFGMQNNASTDTGKIEGAFIIQR